MLNIAYIMGFIGVAVGTLFLGPAHGSAQARPASCAGVGLESPLEDLTRCAEQGDARSQVSLGWMYANGEGVPEDDAEAVRWYRLGAEQGNANAQASLGWMYANGDGVPEDDEEAVRWYRLSAEQGDAAAQYRLGRMYANGDGVSGDLVYAYMWFNLSAAQGDEGASESKDRMERRMTREQITEAQQLSREWFEAHPPGGD